MSDNHVSVVIPAWQCAETIARALHSVAAQTMRPLEVVVVDDGSTDGTAEAAEACRAALGGVALVVLRQSNSGPGAARNAGIGAARGELIAFLDADDTWRPSKLANSLAALTGNVTLVSHDVTFHDGGKDGFVTDCLASRQRHLNAYVACFLRNFVATSTVVARREALLAAGLFDPSLPSGQDFDLWLRVLALPNAEVCVLPEALTDYYVRPGSISQKVEMRRICSMRILRRSATALLGRARHPRLTAAFRAIIVHYQAATAHYERRQWARALRACWLAPWAALAGMSAVKGGCLGAGARTLLWLWVMVAFVVHVWQFRALASELARRLLL